MNPALCLHSYRTRRFVERRAGGERQLPGGWVCHKFVEVIGVTARVGDVLKLRPERRVERENVFVGLCAWRQWSFVRSFV